MREHPIIPVSAVKESELDMRRQPLRALGGSLLGGKLGRLLTSLLAVGAGRLGSPRRSVDREQQEYSQPLY